MENDASDVRFRGIYLNDHLAGATGMLELVRRAARGADSAEQRRFLEQLARDIGDDRGALLRVMRAAGVPPSRVKQRLAVLAERVGRLKLNGTVLRRSPLSSLVELEAIAVGIGGKRLLWLGLRDAAHSPEARAMFDELIARAEAQLADIETHRLRAVRSFGLTLPMGASEPHERSGEAPA